MTKDMPKNFLFSKPEIIGLGIYKAMMNPKSDVVYLPGFWKIIMFIIKIIPESIFKILNF